MEIFEQYGLEFFSRWLHVLMGITWIGLLYYFNFVQVPSFAGFDAGTRNEAIDKLASRALWWFRWSAFATFVMGMFILYFQDFGGERAMMASDYWRTPRGTAISTGMLLGIIMMLNVWGIIWRNQKIVIANARNVLAGGEPDPAAAEANRAAGMASRQNVIFSFAMLFFMIGAAHFFTSGAFDLSSGGSRAIYWIITIVIVGGLELAALGVFGRAAGGFNAIYDDHKNAIGAAIVLMIVFYVLWEVIF